ncbi:substrate-binding periplasmic protein [Thalassomonas actiniarum]|uniref:Transporter substrate-binding domain-containing protein n=1 Tax=Thalassomonas actiniarum TaxID=485447 RepID=A0AAE9YUG4_9GAMM|nr:transporter substrate-binding domain-containing protein [Thalassomonas actiniarum]WDE01038.1 transporter substrate-binding domain-containing protein [Thalassomonas actiniarum]
MTFSRGIMTRNNQRIFAILILLILLFVISCQVYSATSQPAPQAPEHPELLVLSHPFPPWQFYNEQTGQVDGINVDIVKYIFAKMKIPVKFVEQPWSSAWNTIKKGQAEAIMSASRKTPRKPFLWYPREDLWVSEYVFFVKKSKKRPLLGSYAEMKKLEAKIGIVNGYSYHKSFWSAFPYQNGAASYIPDNRDYHQQLYGVRTPELLFKMIEFERMDVVLNDKSIGLYLINTLGLQDSISYYDNVLFFKGYPMPFAKMSNYPGLKGIAERFEQLLLESKRDGSYQKLVDNWLLRNGLML